MAKLELRFSEAVQGIFEIKPLNVLLTFQVNCPGCFIHALPVAQELYEKYSPKGVNVFALSTAFEDFELNTAENTRLLLTSGKIVGETKNALGAQGFDVYPQRLDFPVLMDALLPSSELLSEEHLIRICDSIPDFESWDAAMQASAKAEITNYFGRYEKIPFTFTVNGFAGTPTWVIFDRDHEILARWFGHRSFSEIEWILNSLSK